MWFVPESTLRYRHRAKYIYPHGTRMDIEEYRTRTIDLYKILEYDFDTDEPNARYIRSVLNTKLLEQRDV